MAKSGPARWKHGWVPLNAAAREILVARRQAGLGPGGEAPAPPTKGASVIPSKHGGFNVVHKGKLVANHDKKAHAEAHRDKLNESSKTVAKVQPSAHGGHNVVHRGKLIANHSSKKAAQAHADRLNLATEAAGVVLELAGKWKHGWIPLDAVAALVKAKKYKGGGGGAPGGGLPTGKNRRRNKGRTSEAVMARRAPAQGRPKRAPTIEQSRKATPGHVPEAHKAAAREAVRMKASELRPRAEAGDKIAQAELTRRADARKAKGAATPRMVRDAQDRHRSLEGERVAADEVAGVRSWSDDELRAAITAHGSDTRLGTISHAELERRGKPTALQAPRDSARIEASHPLGATVDARQPGVADRVTRGKVVGHEGRSVLQVEYQDRHGKAVVGKFNAHHADVVDSGPAALSGDERSRMTRAEQSLHDAGLKPGDEVRVGSFTAPNPAFSEGASPDAHVVVRPARNGNVTVRHVPTGTTRDVDASRLAKPGADASSAPAPASLDAKRAERAAQTPRQIHDRLQADPSSVSMDELQRLSRLGGGFAPAANAEIGRRDGPAAVWGPGLTSSRVDVSRETSAPAASSGITIEHSGDGTVVHGTSRSDTETNDVLKRNGFKWSARLNGWYLPRTWGEATRAQRVNAVRSALGDKVSVDRGSVARSGTAAERADARVQRDAELAAQHTQQAGKLHAVADERFGAARRVQDGIPLGQPILVGHHSEGRHRRDIARIDTNMRKGVEAHTEAQAAEQRAESAAARVKLATNPQALSRRIDRNSAELRRLDRMLNGTGKAIHGMDQPHPPGEHRDRLQAMRDDLAGSIEHDRQTLAATGAPSHSRETVKPGDYVRIRGSLMQVDKASPKTVTVKSHGLTLKYPYSEIQTHATSTDILAKASDAQLLAVTRSAPGTSLAAEAQRELDGRRARGTGKGQ